MYITAGSKDATVAFVGDCLTTDDQRIGRAFMGTVGTAIKEPLLRLGYNLNTDIYFTYFNKSTTNNAHLLKCLKDRKNSRELKRDIHIQTFDDFDRAKERLIEELKSLPNLKYIVTLGNDPLFALTGYWGASYRRGSVYRFNQTDILILCMEHPKTWVGYYTSFGKYVYGDVVSLRLGHKDLQKLKAGLSIDDPTIIVAPNIDMVKSYFNKCFEVGKCAIDIECSRDTYEIDGKMVKPISCFSLSCEKTSAISIPILHQDNTSYYSSEDFGYIITWLRELCNNKNIVKVFQNALFDMSILNREWGITFRNIKDTMVYFGILYPDFRKGLDTITSVCTNIPYYKDEGKEFIKLNSTGEMFWRYNALDAVATFYSYKVLDEWVERNGLKQTVDNQNNLIEPLLYMMKRGIRVDLTSLVKQKQDYADQIATLEQKFLDVSGLRSINLNSPKQLKEYFYGTLGIAPYKSRITGNATVDELALQRLARRKIEPASIILEHRKLSKHLNTYLNVSLDDDNRLRGQFNPVGTTSGRLSCSKTAYNTGLNIQTLPHDFKELLLADKGYLVYEMDLAAAENRIVAYISPDVNMIKAFETGTDLHSLTASLICGLSIEEIQRQNSLDIPASIGKKDKTWRFWGKKANHGLNYGQGFDAFSIQNELPRDEAKFIVERYYSAYPGIADYHRWVENQLSASRQLTNLFGRKRIYLKRLDKNTLREAYSFIPQSSVADIINHKGLKDIWEHRFGWARYIELLNDVHDSLVFQIPISAGLDYHVKTIIKIKELLEVSMYWKGRLFTIPVNIGVGHSLGKLTEVNFNQNHYQIKTKLQEISDGLLD